MEKFEITDEFFKELEKVKNENLPTDDDLAARQEMQKMSEGSPLMKGDRDKEFHARNDSLKRTEETKEN